MTSFSSIHQKNEFDFHFHSFCNIIGTEKVTNWFSTCSEQVYHDSDGDLTLRHEPSKCGSFFNLKKMTRFGLLLSHFHELNSGTFVIYTNAYSPDNLRMEFILRSEGKRDSEMTDSFNRPMFWDVPITCISFQYVKSIGAITMTIDAGRWGLEIYVYENGSIRMFTYGNVGDAKRHFQVSVTCAIVYFTEGGWHLNVTNGEKMFCRMFPPTASVYREIGFEKSNSQWQDIFAESRRSTIVYAYSVSSDIFTRLVADFFREAGTSRMNALADAFECANVGSVVVMRDDPVYIRKVNRSRIKAIGGRLPKDGHMIDTDMMFR